MRRPPALRAGIAAAVTLTALCWVPVTRAAPVPIDDPELVAGCDALRAGEIERARTVLERVAPRLTSECTAGRASLDGDDPRLLRACHHAAFAWLHLGLARGAAGDGTDAHQAFTRGLMLEPEALPLADLTPPKLRRLFEAARPAALGRERAADPGSIAGLTHRPPLVAVRGQALVLDLQPTGDWERAGTIEVVHSGDGAASGWVRTPLHLGERLWSAEIPAGATLGRRALHYRFDAVDAAGRVHRSRWYPVHVLGSLADLEAQALPLLADEVDGPALDAVRRLGVSTELAPAAALPKGVTGVAARLDSPDRSVAREVAATIFR